MSHLELPYGLRNEKKTLFDSAYQASADHA